MTTNEAPEPDKREVGELIPDPESGRIDFAPVEGKLLSAETLEFCRKVEEVASLLRILFLQKENEDKSLHAIYFETLVNNASLGLVQPRPDPTAAAQGIQGLLLDIRREHGTRLRSLQLAKLARSCVWGFLIGIVLATTFFWAHIEFGGTADTLVGDYLLFAGNYILMIAMSFVGMWVSYAIRSPIVKLDDISRPRADLMEARWRMALVASCTFIFAVLAHFHVVGIQVADFDTDKTPTHIPSAALFGFCCGFSESLLAGRVIPLIDQMIAQKSR